MNVRRLVPLLAAALATSACERSPAPPTGAPSAPAAPAAPAPYVPDSRFVKEEPAAPAAAPAAEKPEGEQLFSRYGCTACHNPGAAFHDKLAGARGKSEQQVARWILNPRAMKPDTMMPAYGNQLTEAQARALARWVLAGNPGGWNKR